MMTTIQAIPRYGVGTGQIVSADLSQGIPVSGNKRPIILKKEIFHNYNSGNDVLLKGRVLHLISLNEIKPLNEIQINVESELF